MERIIDQETYKATRGRGLTAELEDIRQAAWTAIAQTMAKGEGLETMGGYVRRTARYAIKAYIKAARKAAGG